MNEVRNQQGLWVNTSLFREASIHFKKYGNYITAPWGSKDWFEYWTEERRRCIEGYQVAGCKITGDHYFYLNYYMINKTEDTSAKKSHKSYDFPDFWDGDYNYYWIRQIARDGVLDSLNIEKERMETIINLEEQKKQEQLSILYESLGLEVKVKKYALEGGYNLIVGKSRRKGYSYKNASIGVNNYQTVPGSATYYTAYEKKYLYPAKSAIFTMAISSLNFINDSTAWSMPSDYINKQDHRKASYKEYKNGVEVERGFKSELVALTFKDNPDVMRGKDARDVIIEEAGAFGTPGLLKDCYAASEDCVKDGEIKTGLITVFGTSGDMEGGTADYAEMFMSPERFGMLPFEDVWEDEAGYESTSTGFFHPAHWNLPGFYDKEGNSNLQIAKNAVLEGRKHRISKGANSNDISKMLQERPLKPREAFAYSSYSLFPTQELQRQLDIIKSKNWHILKGQPVNMFRDPDTNKVVVEPDLKGILEPVRSMEHKGSDKGAPVIYEYPIANAPRGLYKIGYDPVRQDKGTSLSAIIVYKGFMRGSYTKNCVVAEYIGRTDTSEETHYIAELFAELYNTQVMYENEVPDVKTYFLRRKKLHLLALQPDKVISKNIKSSTVNRVYGCHMTGQLKDAGEKYANDWFRQVQDFTEEDSPVSVIHGIYSSRFLEEAILYNRKGNFDLMSAFFMCIIQVQEEVLGKDYKQETVASKSAKTLIAMMNDRNKPSLISYN
jgi:hypothetical protein